jgi:Tol biopolymer transport system component/DNA-binding winged helix-turn-helix (wHTH) protein
MQTADRGTDRLRFAGIEFDTRTGELWKDGSRIVLPDQLFRVLAMLIRERGTLVTRDELRGVLWPDDTFVDFEHGLNAAIKRLREALGDSASAPRFIETIPRRGYRFIAAVESGPFAPPVHTAHALDDPHTAGPEAQRPGESTRWTVALLTLTVAGAAIALTIRDASPRKASPPSVVLGLTQLTSTSGLNIDPALSRDGSLIAYASDRHGGTGLDIWVQPIAGGNAMQITFDEGDEAEPSFSADGGSIVYVKREVGGIYVIDARGGESRPLAQLARARTPRFSPDGKWVLYWTGMPLWSALFRGAAHASATLQVVAATGGEPRTLASDFATARFGIWAPDSTHILFLGETDASDPPRALDWYLTSRGGGRAVRTGALDALQKSGVTGAPVPGDWDPRDDSVILASTGSSGSNLWKIKLAANDGRIAGHPERLTFGTAIERSPVLASGGRIAFTSVVENVDVWRVHLDPATGKAAGPMERITDDVGRDRVMNVSDDGRTLAYMASRGGHDAIWLRDLESGRDHEMVDPNAASARINPDGTIVAISHGRPRNEISLVPARGGRRESLCDDCDLGAWAPDGSHIVISRGHPKRLLIRDVRSGGETPLASHPTWHLNQPRFSPDGHWVIFHTTNAPTLRQIYAVSAVTGNSIAFEKWIPIVTDFGIQPSWAPDGHGVYHFSFRDGAFCAWVQPLDPKTMRPVGAPRAVQHLHEPRLRAVTGAEVTNDVRGGYLYVTLTQTTGNIWMMQNDSQQRSATR